MKNHFYERYGYAYYYTSPLLERVLKWKLVIWRRMGVSKGISLNEGHNGNVRFYPLLVIALRANGAYLVDVGIFLFGHLFSLAKSAQGWRPYHGTSR